MRSLATRRAHLATSAVLKDVIELYKAAGFDLVIVETAGIGQTDTEIVDLVDLSLYVMTSEYGAASQLEKIDMLDYADFIVLNKCEKRGAEDSLRDVRKQWRRNHPDGAHRATPRCRCSRPSPAASTTRASTSCSPPCARRSPPRTPAPGRSQDPGPTAPSARAPLMPGERSRYLAEIAQAGGEARARIEAQVSAARRAAGLLRGAEVAARCAAARAARALPAGAAGGRGRRMPRGASCARTTTTRSTRSGARRWRNCKGWPARARAATESQLLLPGARPCRDGRELHREPRAHCRSRSSPCRASGTGASCCTSSSARTCPAPSPTPAGVYPYRREEEDPTRMFAGEGAPERTNRRFHYLADGHGAARLSTAFDSTTLYGEDPDTRPDIYGRTGNSGVSIATLDDMKKLYSGFDLCSAERPRCR